MKQWRRKLAALLASVMLLAMLPVMAYAVEVVDSGECGDQGDNLTWSLDSEGTLTISGTGKMADYATNMVETDEPVAPWTKHRHTIREVIIQNGVASIGSFAFQGYENLTNIDISESVNSIGRYAFGSCTALTNISIPKGVTIIGDWAFTNCSGLAEINISESVTTIESAAFWGCNTLTGVAIPESMTSIGEAVFGRCTSLTDVSIPESVTTIESAAFWGCTSLTHIAIPNSVTSIEYEAFAFTSLVAVTIPASVDNIEAPFIGCTKLPAITVDSANSSLTSINGVLFSKDMTELIEYPAGKSDTTYDIPEGVTSIEDSAFYLCSSLNNITLPESMTSIGPLAFTGCSGLTSITIPSHVSYIGVGGFDGCSSLTSITIPNGVDGIGEFVFYNCSSLTSVTIPTSVSWISEDAFSGCTSLKDIYYSGSETQWEQIEIYDDLSNATIHFNSETDDKMVLPEGVKDIPYSYTLPKVMEDASYTDEFSIYGALPNGLALDSETGIISGIPTEAGTFEFEVAATEYFDGEIVGGYDAVCTLTINDETAALPSGVRYVPYSYFFDGSEEENVRTEFLIETGTLPSGLTLNQSTGELSGVPMASGTFEFTYSIDFYATDVVSGDDYLAGGTSYPQLLVIEDNTNTAVQRPNDYEITTPVGVPSGYDPNAFILDSYRDETLVIEGPYSEFMVLRIDGRELKRDVEYSVREGSTVITIYAQTFQKYGEGTHTISAEFREGGKADGKLKTVSQNYTVKLRQPSPNPGGSSSGGSSGGSSNSKPTKPSKPAEPTTPKPTVPTPPVVPAMPFTDVTADRWFYDDVKWAYDGKIMTGTTATTFAPNTDISQATIVTVLARIAGVDLEKFSNTVDSSIESGKYYTEAAMWAKQSGLLPDYSAFTGEGTISRDQMAIMLVKYLRSMGKDTTPPAQPVAFADAEQMSADGNAAFQVLYQRNIFRGMGDGRMDPAGFTTRAQFAALVHRVSNAANG